MRYLVIFLSGILAAMLDLSSTPEKQRQSVSTCDSVLYFAHRGISLLYPEHSRGAANAAKDLGFNAIEIDVRRTGDGKYIVFHDETTDRMLGFSAKVDTTSLEKMKSVPLLFNSSPGTDTVLTLEEFIKEYKDSFIIYLDMKISSFENARDMVTIIKDLSALDRCIVASSDASFVFYIESRFPSVITALEGFDAGKEFTWKLMPKGLKPDYISGYYQNINAEHIAWLKKRGLLNSRIVYGVDSSNFDEVKAAGLVNIMMDYDTTMKNIFQKPLCSR